jgi:hypothetical protein
MPLIAYLRTTSHTFYITSKVDNRSQGNCIRTSTNKRFETSAVTTSTFKPIRCQFLTHNNNQGLLAILNLFYRLQIFSRYQQQLFLLRRIKNFTMLRGIIICSFILDFDIPLKLLHLKLIQEPKVCLPFMLVKFGRFHHF